MQKLIDGNWLIQSQHFPILFLQFQIQNMGMYFFHFILNDSSFIYSCAQTCHGSEACPKKISENCLSLNVWTPFVNETQLPSIDTFNGTETGQNSLLPVIVFLYGGSFKTVYFKKI